LVAVKWLHQDLPQDILSISIFWSYNFILYYLEYSGCQACLGLPWRLTFFSIVAHFLPFSKISTTKHIMNKFQNTSMGPVARYTLGYIFLLGCNPRGTLGHTLGYTEQPTPESILPLFSVHLHYLAQNICLAFSNSS